MRRLVGPPRRENFNRYVYVYTPPRPLAEIDADLARAEAEILRLLQEVTT